MTVKELIDYLSELQENYKVVLSKDGEGNSFSPLSLGFTVCEYIPETTWSGEIRTKENYEEGGWGGDLSIEDYEPNAVVLWPTN